MVFAPRFFIPNSRKRLWERSNCFFSNLCEWIRYPNIFRENAANLNFLPDCLIRASLGLQLLTLGREVDKLRVRALRISVRQGQDCFYSSVLDDLLTAGRNFNWTSPLTSTLGNLQFSRILCYFSRFVKIQIVNFNDGKIGISWPQMSRVSLR